MDTLTVTRSLSPELVALAALAAMSPACANPRVLRRELVSVETVGLTSVQGRETIAPENVDTHCHDLHVGGSNASVCAAQMVEGHALGDGSNEEFPSDPMGQLGTTVAPADSEAPIPIGVAGRSPYPTVARLIDLRPEAVCDGPLGSTPILNQAGADPVFTAEASCNGLLAALTGTGRGIHSKLQSAVTLAPSRRYTDTHNVSVDYPEPEGKT